MSRRGAVATAVAVAVLAVLAQPAGATHGPVLHGDTVWPPGAQRAPQFTLRDQDGRAFSLRAQRGKVVVLTFLDSRCTSLCPLEGRDLARTERRVGESGRWELVVVSVDPIGADTPASIRAFARHADWPPTGWHWLVGSRRGLHAVWAAVRDRGRGKQRPFERDLPDRQPRLRAHRLHLPDGRDAPARRRRQDADPLGLRRMAVARGRWLTRSRGRPRRARGRPDGDQPHPPPAAVVVGAGTGCG